MISSNIAKRYARAFFEIAREDGLYEKYYLELTLFSSIVKENKDLKDLLLNPVFDQAEKRAVVDSLLKKVDISNITATEPVMTAARPLTSMRSLGFLGSD